MARHISTQIFIALVALICILGSYSATAQPSQPSFLAVIYPGLPAPYGGVISSIVSGIQEQARNPVRLYPLGNGHDISELEQAAKQGRVAAIITLGKSSYTAVEQWRGKIPIVIGASLMTPDAKESGVTGISLAADPELLLAHLKRIEPSVKKLHIVYSPKYSSWLVDLAKAAAKKFNLEFHAYKSRDISSSALIYRDVLNASHPGEDAILLLPDPVAVDSRITLPLLLRGAWNNDVILFSSNPAQVKRGALFALYPNNKKMGGSLAKLAESNIKANAKDIKNTILPLTDLLAAINVRTAEHLGLTISSKERKGYELIFPAP